MNTLAFVHQNSQTGIKPNATGRSLLAKAQVVGSVVGLAGSLIVALSGSLLIVAGWLVANEGVRHWLSTAGSVLLILTIPLLILAAFCLDWVEKDEPRRHSKVAQYDDEDDEF